MNWTEWISIDRLINGVQSAIVLLVGIPLLILVSRWIGSVVEKNYTPQSAMLVRKGIFYFGLVLLVIVELQHLGFKITALLGAAGVAGVAIGFASQTSLSNLISGIFLIFEKPFEVGDVIGVGDTTGTVLSIDLLSVKLRQFDNKFVRIPNESVIKGQVTNVTRFPIRRYDITLGVAFKEDIKRVIGILKDVASNNIYCLDEPEPIILFTGFGDSALTILFAVWFQKADFLALRNSLLPELKERFDREGIEIPFPHRTLYTGTVTTPLPIRMVQDSSDNVATPN